MDKTAKKHHKGPLGSIGTHTLKLGRRKLNAISPCQKGVDGPKLTTRYPDARTD